MFRIVKLFVLPVLLTAALAALGGNVQTANASTLKTPPPRVAIVHTMPIGGNTCEELGFPIPAWWRHLICGAGPKPGLPTTPPQGGKGGDGCTVNCDNGSGDNPPPFVKSQRNSVLYCAPTALHRVGERDGRAMNLGVDEISDSGVYNYSEGPVQMTNAFYVYEAGPFYGAGCDLPPGYVVTSTRVDNLGNPDPNGPYYAAVPIKP